MACIFDILGADGVLNTRPNRANKSHIGLVVNLGKCIYNLLMTLGKQDELGDAYLSSRYMGSDVLPFRCLHTVTVLPESRGASSKGWAGNVV